jgi:DNA-binding CsgD family transcriptional regulator
MRPESWEDVMPRVGQFPECSLADCALQVAESRSVEALGAACRRAISRLNGHPTFGLYWLYGEGPQLFANAGIPDGFDDDYRSGLAKCDPFIDSVLCHGRVVDGRSLIGPNHWLRSTAYDLLRTWGLSYNMCGPLRLEERIVGVFYTGTPDWNAPYTSDDRQRMELLCRASSLALTNLAKAGAISEKAGPRPDGPQPTGHDLPAVPATSPLHEQLPPRAADVARLVCRGRSNKEIARDMGISDQTVKDHVANLCRRFGALNRTELAARLQSGMPRQ